MHDSPRQILARIIAERGRAICDSPKRVEAILRDLAPSHRREINIIVGALEERVAADLIAAGKSVPRDVLLARLAARLRDNLAYTPEAARWGVETWALALGFLTEAEIAERARVEPTDDKTDKTTASSPATDTAHAATTQRPQTGRPSPAPVSSPPPPKRPAIHDTPNPPTQAPKPPPSHAQTPPPLFPARSPSPSPQPRRNAPRTNIVATPPLARNLPLPIVQPQTAPAPPSPRRGGTLRGCLIAVVLLLVVIVAAVFVVPAVILVLQQEQAQPSINEPRIR